MNIPEFTKEYQTLPESCFLLGPITTKNNLRVYFAYIHLYIASSVDESVVNLHKTNFRNFAVAYLLTRKNEPKDLFKNYFAFLRKSSQYNPFGYIIKGASVLYTNGNNKFAGLSWGDLSFGSTKDPDKLCLCYSGTDIPVYAISYKSDSVDEDDKRAMVDQLTLSQDQGQLLPKVEDIKKWGQPSAVGYKFRKEFITYSLIVVTFFLLAYYTLKLIG